MNCNPNVIVDNVFDKLFGLYYYVNDIATTGVCYYDYLDLNINAFNEILFNPEDEQKLTRNENSIINFINAALSQGNDLPSYNRKYLNKVKDLIIEGHITKNKAKAINKLLKDNAIDAESTITILRKNIRDEDLKTTTNDNSDDEIKEIVLSEYFK